MDLQEIKTKNREELLQALDASHRELLQLRIRLATKQLANYNQLHQVKKTIARIRTILRQREFLGA